MFGIDIIECQRNFGVSLSMVGSLIHARGLTGRRHLWATVHLLHQYFGRDGRDDADELLELSIPSRRFNRNMGIYRRLSLHDTRDARPSAADRSGA